MSKKLKHLKSFKNNNDQDKLNSLYNDIKYLSLELIDNKINHNIWVSNIWDVKLGGYKVTIKLSILDITTDIIEILDIIKPDKDLKNWIDREIKPNRSTNRIWNLSQELPTLNSSKRDSLFDSLLGINDYVLYNNGLISASLKEVEGLYYSDDLSRYIVINMDFGIVSKFKLNP